MTLPIQLRSIHKLNRAVFLYKQVPIPKKYRHLLVFCATLCYSLLMKQKQKKRHVHMYLSEEMYQRMRAHCDTYGSAFGHEAEMAFALYLDMIAYREDPITVMREKRKEQE